jgi:hypothetical protein
MTASESRSRVDRFFASVYTFYRFVKAMRCQRDAIYGLARASKDMGSTISVSVRRKTS